LLEKARSIDDWTSSDENVGAPQTGFAPDEEDAATASREIWVAADLEATGAKTGNAITSCVVAVKVESSCKMVQVKATASAAPVATERFIAS
jgi:hypothetical protein|tara:strand:- start:199 stop:474 length:276 start_codon:yes stop_codon:yes gene_type:complete